MKFIHKMELVLIAIIGLLCVILLLKMLFKLRSTLPWRVNCWFCNGNFWVKLNERNSWTCPKCEQYNGFTKEGDYNKPLSIAGDQSHKIPKVFHSSPPKNGLCKMCNINQQLKVTQLANFVPMNDNNFDHEIECYRLQLEKAYKLCSPCKKVIQMKLHKEKESLLGTKLLETRSPDKKRQNVDKPSRLHRLIANTSMYIAMLLFVLVSFECYSSVKNSKNLPTSVVNLKDILFGITERICSIVKMKLFSTFPSLEVYVNEYKVLYLDDMLKYFQFDYELLSFNILTQQCLGGFVIVMKIIEHSWIMSKMDFTVIIDMMWPVFVATSFVNVGETDSTVMSLAKITCLLAVLVFNNGTKNKSTQRSVRINVSPKGMKNLTSPTVNFMIDDDDSVTMDTDDDVSLSKYGLHSLSDSSNETVSPLNKSLISGRSFTPRTNLSDSIWTKPSLNSTFCVNSILSKCPSSVSDTVFIKPTFNKYQHPVKEDSDSDLDESINLLRISSPKKASSNTNSIFSLRKFTASPNFVAPSPMTRSRPLISPSKLGHSTSWVAGGYWGTESERQIFNLNNSRSSSQSSGFESQTSSMNQRNIFSQPSREESIFTDIDKNSMLMDRFQNCTVTNFGKSQVPLNFSRVSTPVFPQMQYNSHVHIPQARFAQQNISHNMFTQQYVQNSLFKAPGGSTLIRLPQVNSFSSH